MVRKQRGKNIDPKLEEYANKFDEIFNQIQKISHNFVKELEEDKFSEFKEVYTKYNNLIKDFGEKILFLKRNVREFGIY